MSGIPPHSVDLMTLYNKPQIVHQMADIELMQLDRSTAEQEMDEMVANS